MGASAAVAGILAMLSILYRTLCWGRECCALMRLVQSPRNTKDIFASFVRGHLCQVSTDTAKQYVVDGAAIATESTSKISPNLVSDELSAPLTPRACASSMQILAQSLEKRKFHDGSSVLYCTIRARSHISHSYSS